MKNNFDRSLWFENLSFINFGVKNGYVFLICLIQNEEKCPHFEILKIIFKSNPMSK
jgi:hypothetical protein